MKILSGCARALAFLPVLGVAAAGAGGQGVSDKKEMSAPAPSSAAKQEAAAQKKYQYFRAGNPHDVARSTRAGYALIGGGPDLDEAFQYLCERGNGGDFLVLRATGDDAYNPYIAKLCKMNSVATLVIPDRAAAEDPFVAETIAHAEVVFISGGDQANYIRHWQGTPVQRELQARIAAGAPVGGTSAGLAVLGQFVFAALHDTAYSKQTLADPFSEGVTITRDFVSIPHLEKTITDTHFARRDRLGRSLGFLARILNDGGAASDAKTGSASAAASSSASAEVREIAVDEGSAVLLEPDGKARVVGRRPEVASASADADEKNSLAYQTRGAYFIRPTGKPQVCKPGEPLTFRNMAVFKAPPGATFDLVSWRGAGGESYMLDVEQGTVRSSKKDGSPY